VLNSDGRTILAALNGWGVARIEGSPDGSAYRVVGSPLPLSFAALTTAGAWPTTRPAAGGVGRGFLVQLYRDPFRVANDPFGIANDAIEASTDPLGAAEEKGKASAGDGQGGAAPARLVFFDEKGAASAGDETVLGELGREAGWELFALFPVSGGWLAELRGEAEGRSSIRFFRVEEGRAGARSREVGRAEFEDALRPRAYAELGPEVGGALREALESLGAGRRLVRLRDGSGADGYFFEGKKPEDAAPAYAWRGREALLVLLPEGGLARAPLGAAAAREKVATLRLEAPAEGASFTALAAAEPPEGEDGAAARRGKAGGLVAAGWEAGEFPSVGAAGLVVTLAPAGD